MSTAAVLKSFVSGSPDKRVKKLEADVEAVDRKVEKIAARAAELQKALDDGDGDAAAIVATAATLATARAERAVLSAPLDAARKLVAQAAAEEAARQAEARLAELLAEGEKTGADLQAALAETCRQLGRFIPLEAQLKHVGRLRTGLDGYCQAAGKVACKDLVVPWGEDRQYTQSVSLVLTVPLVPNP